MGLPYHPFFWTLDQIADIFQVSDPRSLIHFDGRSTGARPDNLMLAVNVMPGGKPEWRVEEQELLRWMRHMGFGALVRPNRLR